MTKEQRERIKAIFVRFLQERYKKVSKLSITDLNVNPFLIKLLAPSLDMREPRDVVRWLMQQRLERGAVTSLGIALQDAAKVFSEGTGVEGADILKTKEGTHYHIQIKSGPNTIPKGLGVRLASLLRSAQRRNRGSVALYGMCYGAPRQVSGIVRKYVRQEGGVDWLAGRAFWEFISDDPKCIDEVYNIAAEVAETFRAPDGRSLRQLIIDRMEELTAQFIQLYGEDVDTMWANLLKLNS
ncbi:MAG: hypothetical protein DRH70_01170 [Candidatus Coatesbacteria bacterium]|nr:MAG: hypothetical protein DRH70_01170 [Candidatus Coatesbacteria bacterium]